MPGSLVFGAATSDRVDFGAVTDFDNMSAFTVLGFFYATNVTIGTTTYMFSKRISSGWYVSRINGGPNLRFLWTRSVSNVDFQTNTSPVAINTWYGFAFVIDKAATPIVKAYQYSAGAISAVTFSSTGAGSGTYTAETGNFTVANSADVSPVNAFKGRVGPVALYPGVTLTSSQCLGWFQSPRVMASTCRFWRLGNEGTGSQQDYSGNGNAGTVYGATQGNGPPIGGNWTRRKSLYLRA